MLHLSYTLRYNMKESAEPCLLLCQTDITP